MEECGGIVGKYPRLVWFAVGVVVGWLFGLVAVYLTLTGKPWA